MVFAWDVRYSKYLGHWGGSGDKKTRLVKNQRMSRKKLESKANLGFFYQLDKLNLLIFEYKVCWLPICYRMAVKDIIYFIEKWGKN